MSLKKSYFLFVFLSSALKKRVPQKNAQLCMVQNSGVLEVTFDPVGEVCVCEMCVEIVFLEKKAKNRALFFKNLERLCDCGFVGSDFCAEFER